MGMSNSSTTVCSIGKKTRLENNKLLFCWIFEKILGVSNFTILVLEVSLKLEMHISLKILNLMGEIKLETLF